MAEQNDIPVAGPEGKESIQGSSVRPEIIREDEGIFCPICNYNLSGVFSGRCPECGALFDRQRLLDTQQAHRITLIPWDDPRDMPLIRRAWETLKISLINPDRFAHAFTVQRQASRVGSFYAICLLGIAAIAAAYPLLGVAFSHLFSGLPSMPNWRQDSFGARELAFVFAVLSLYHLLATLSAASLLWLLYPHFDGKRRFRPWASVCGYAGAHYLLILIGLPVAAGISAGFPPDNAPGIALLVLGLCWFGCGILATATLVGVVRSRSLRHRSYWLVRILLFLNYACGPGLPVAAIVLMVRLVQFVLAS